MPYRFRSLFLASCALSSLIAAPLHAEAAKAPQADQDGIAEGSAIVVTATRPNRIAPVTSSLQATQPQSIVSRSFIEDSLPATADFNLIALISPSVSNTGNTNGPGLSESKSQIRGFQDGEYNVTYDGIPFGDTNDPTHHSNTFFPSNTIETLIVDRGPGNADMLGQATFGGNINMFSRAVRADPSVELKGSYGTWNTYLARAVVQTGAVLGEGSGGVISGQYTKSDGARTLSPFNSKNIFGKFVLPLSHVGRITLLATYNENDFHQPDNDGATLSQVAAFGKDFSLSNDPNSQTFTGYNKTHKTTDFEIAHVELSPGAGLSFDNKTYTYSYDNETLSGTDVTLFATATPAQIALANVVTPVSGGPAVAGVPGYTKTNKYRVVGNIFRGDYDFGIGTLTAGIWYETSDTYRQQRDVNLVNMAPNYVEKAVTNPATGVATPRNIRFDQNSSISHIEGFGKIEIRPIPELKITPGIKHISFRRNIAANYNQTVRYGQFSSATYHATLPFLTVNYAVTPLLSLYGEYARGFLAPPLNVLYVANPSLSSVAPQRSNNFQAGAVYHGRHLSVDADAYLINFTNKFASFTSTVPGQGVVFINQGGARYKGVEGQVTYAFDNGFALFANGSRNYAKTHNPGVIEQQVAKAPEYTAAGGVIYKHGPLRFSLIDKWIGKQWFATPAGSIFAGNDYDNPLYQSSGYNTAIAAARYDIGPVRIGVEVNNLFNSRRVTNISTAKTPTFSQYFFQPERSITGDVTVTF